nr:zinc finger, CCHC-type [Tanacetum cinerariifolium]
MYIEVGERRLHLHRTLTKRYIWSPLLDIYQNVESVKELWDSLESKYMAEDASSKKFLVSNFNNYKMVNSRPIMEQLNELLRILRQYTLHGLKMDESICVLSVIDKLPPFLKDFKHSLKHGKDDLSLVRLVPTKSLKWHVGNVTKLVTLRMIVVVETRRITQALVFREMGLRTILKTKVNAIARWIDSRVTTHICKGRCWLLKNEPVEDGSVLYMGDTHFALVHGKGSVVLEFSSEKSITLFNVLKFNESGKCVIICLYVDDILIYDTDHNQVDKTKKFLSSKFSMKDIGEAVVILGIKIKRKYVAQLEYSKAIGCLMYAMTSTRPDTTYEISRLTRYPSVLESYSDAGWINLVKDSSSTSGWVFLLGGWIIS